VNHRFLESLAEGLAALDEAGLRRSLSQLDGRQNPVMVLNGVPVVNLSSNNYLGLAGDPALVQGAANAMSEAGVGAGASRLIAGNLAPHRVFETELANWLGVEAALLFNSGYQANIGVLTALAGPGDVIFSDALNHASIIDGCRLARAETSIYRHLDLADLESRLRARSGTGRKLVVTESLFSMDGDRAPLSGLAELARRHDAILIVDDAHGIGAMGPLGRGLTEGLGPDVLIGPLGKAFGVFGAFVAGSQVLVDWLINRARSFIFTTALPVPVVGALRAALALIRGPVGQERRAALHRWVELFHVELSRVGWALPSAPSHILPLGVTGGDPVKAMAMSRGLAERGVFVHGIRPPTVPVGTSRLRLSLMATLTETQARQAFEALAEIRR